MSQSQQSPLSEKPVGTKDTVCPGTCDAAPENDFCFGCPHAAARDARITIEDIRSLSRRRTTNQGHLLRRFRT